MEVAVLVTNYNHRNYIQDCIKSLLNQSYKNFKVFIIDDNSTDDSVEVIKNLVDNDNRFQLYRNNINLGKSKSLNRLLNRIDIERYPYIALLDSDDVWKTDKLKFQVEYLLKHKCIDICYTEGELLYEGLYHVGAWGFKEGNKLFSDIHRAPKTRSEDILDELLVGNFIFYSTLVMRSHVFINIEFNNLIRRSMDWLFLIELAKKYKFGYIDIPLADYRIHNNNLQTKVGQTHEVILPRLFVIHNYKHLMSRSTIANHYYVLSRHVLDLKVRQKYVDFFIYYLAGLLHYPKLSKIIKLPLNYLKSLFN